MVKIAKIVRNEVTEVDGVLAVVLFGQTDQAAVSMAIPVAAFETFVADTRRRVQAWLSQVNRKVAGEYISAKPLTAQTYTLGRFQTNTGEKVALTFDMGTPTELTFLIEPSHAREVAAQLVVEADTANPARPSQN